MVRYAAGEAGASVGAEGFLAGMDGVASKQEGDPEDPHPGASRWVIPTVIHLLIGISQRRISGRLRHRRRNQGRGHIDMVDEVPLAVVLDGTEAVAEKVHVHGCQRRLQQSEHGIVGRVVEVAPGDDPVDADGDERIRQESEPLHGDPPPGLRLRRPAVLGRVVVHQHGERKWVGHDGGTGSSEHA